jgi:hypothetical protein
MGSPLTAWGLLCVVYQEAKYVEGWPNTTSAWSGWSRFDIPLERYGGVHSLLLCTGVFTPATRLASRKILIEKNLKSVQGQHSVYYVVVYTLVYPEAIFTNSSRTKFVNCTNVL